MYISLKLAGYLEYRTVGVRRIYDNTATVSHKHPLLQVHRSSTNVPYELTIEGICVFKCLLAPRALRGVVPTVRIYTEWRSVLISLSSIKVRDRKHKEPKVFFKVDHSCN